jgi:hypothetical protein
MEKVIGGEFSLPLFDENHVINDRCYPFTTGRTALAWIIWDIKRKKAGITSVAVPDYICSSVTSTIYENGMHVVFYHILEKTLLPEQSSLFNCIDKHTALLLVSYFGMTDIEDTISEVNTKHYNIPIIIDNVQNFYGINDLFSADYSFTSFRKWFPSPDGAIVKVRSGGEMNT